MTKTKGEKLGRPTTGRDKAYSFRLPAALVGRIAEAAEAGGVNHSAIVRKALELGLDAMAPSRTSRSRSKKGNRPA
jgi:predicted DNA-binding protein